MIKFNFLSNKFIILLKLKKDKNLIMFKEKDIYKLTLIDIHGRKLSLEPFKNKVLIIVNLESLDGFAKQTLLHLKHFKEEDFSDTFEILVFPVSDYLRSDQCKREVVKEFFLPFKNELKLFDFISLNGKNVLFEYLFCIFKEWRGNELRCNLGKFVVYNGKVIHFYKSNELPLHSDDELRMFRKKRSVDEKKKKKEEEENFY